MAFSVNTNPSALLALQMLSKTNARLEVLQRQIATGLKVSSAKDNAAVFAIAQRMRGEVAGLNAARGSIDRALSEVDVALAAGEAISDLMIEMKELVVAAKDPGLDSASRKSLNDEFIQLRDQINSIANNATFNGRNAVKNGGNSIQAITDSTGSAANVITIAAQDFSLEGNTVNLLSLTSNISSIEGAGSVQALLETSLDNVNEALSKLGAGAKRLEIQKEFTGKLQDSINVGIGNLVDADMARVSAEYNALLVRQQLGLQALAIANQGPQLILALFR
ncbi:flagellin [Gimibacter soli]|uniref:Flagellin n=1 Tax=Gimibacter soli TaxID=3024400 RepID=A0AAE9XUB5_9PROT|nr:flagellin [Gimibacter soli]WCL53673.1 flagellin [Gimibacter soli]